MTDRPILFSAPMVRAILDGSKTQTRRVVKPQPVDRGGGSLSISYAAGKMNHMGPAGFMLEKLAQYGCPYGKTGDRLWVRETLKLKNVVNTVNGELGIAAYYAAGGNTKAFMWDGHRDVETIPSIYMPRWASRITLDITDVRIERLQDISDEDALAEGVDQTNTSIGGYAVERFKRLWQSINGTDSWDANPWVWVVEFKRVQP